MRYNPPRTPLPIFCLWCKTSISVSLITAAEKETGPQSPNAAYTHVLWMLGWLSSWQTACSWRALQIRSHPFGSLRTLAQCRPADVEWRNSSFESEEMGSRQPHICEPIWLRDWCVLSHVTAHSLLWTTRTASGSQINRPKRWDISIPSTWSSHGAGCLCQQIKQGERVTTAYFVCGRIESDTFLNLKQVLHKYR